MTSDYQRVVEYLRDLRQGPLQTVNDEIAQAAADYAALCVQANERLRKCSAFLQQGLRTEAIHLADESPNLLDLVAALDLPDPQTWNDFCQNNGLPVAPPLQMDRASQLNEAYSLDQPLEHLLSKHRFLALSRAPVRQRLAVLRQIAQIDAASGTWEKDIRVFERARLRELPTSFYTAVKNRDEPGIAALMNELTQNPWFEPVPQDLTAAVGDAFSRMQRAACEAELRKLVEPLRDAFAARSLQECQALAARWKKIMAANNVTRIAADLEDEIRPVVGFIHDTEKREDYLKRFRDSCRAFGKMLDRDAPDTDLEAGYAKLGEFKEPIPEELTARYGEKRLLRQQAIERRHKTRLVGIGAGVAAIVALAVVVGWMLLRTSNAHGWAIKIQQANSAHRLDLAQSYISELKKTHPGFLDDRDVAAAVKETETMQLHYNNQAAMLADLLQKVDAADKSATPVAADPKATVDDMLANAAVIETTLEAARNDGDLSWVDTDRRLANGEVRLQALLTGLRSRASAAVRAEVQQHSATLDAMPISPESVSLAYAQLTRISDRLWALKAASAVDDQTRAAVAALADKIDKRRQEMDAMRDVAGELDVIRQQAASADDLKKALAGFVQRFPADPRTPDFKNAIARLPWAKSLETWRDLTAPWLKQLAPATAAAAQKRVDAITAYLTANPDSPIAPAAQAYQDYARRAADALGDKGAWQDVMGPLLSNPIMSELAYLDTSDKRRFYVLGDMQRTERRINDQVSVTFQAVNPLKIDERILVSVDAPTTVSEKPVPLPHVKIVTEAADAIKRIDETNWETWGTDFAEQLRHKSDVDIVVRAILVQQALKGEDAVAGWALGDTYAKTVSELARQKPEEIPWMDPAKVSAGARKALGEILDAMPPAAAVKKILAARKAALFKAAAFQIVATGVALRDDAGNWVITGASAAGNGSTAWTVVPANNPPLPASATAPATPGRLLQVGTVANGKLNLDENALRSVVQGSIVYFTK